MAWTWLNVAFPTSAGLPVQGPLSSCNPDESILSSPHQHPVSHPLPPPLPPPPAEKGLAKHAESAASKKGDSNPSLWVSEPVGSIEFIHRLKNFLRWGDFWNEFPKDNEQYKCHLYSQNRPSLLSRLWARPLPPSPQQLRTHQIN